MTQQMVIDPTTGVTFGDSSNQNTAYIPRTSMIRLAGANGYGSTNTLIRRYSSVVSNTGSDITLNQSATLGDSFTINTAGMYAIVATDSFNTSANFGISNTASVATPILNLSTSDRLGAVGTPGADYVCQATFTGYLPAGAVIRTHTQLSFGASTNLQYSAFVIARID